METDSPEREPLLAAPGAGLPGPERHLGRLLFTLKRRFGSRDAFSRQFDETRAAIREAVSAIPVADRGRRVLIPRLRGLEDSSRYWSVWMTLDHLRITHLAFAGIIAQLAKERVPPGKADTAAVKPAAGAGAEAEPAFEAACDALVKTVARAANLKTRARFAHPWFGPLDAAGWHALAALHLGIHRAQIGEIARRLREP